MKRLNNVLLLLFCVISLVSCKSSDILLFLNWGEYIDDELIEAFEDKYNVQVLMDLGESNDIFYSKVRSGTTVYDVICPSDYTVEKMYANDMLEKIDFSLLPSYNKNDLMPGVEKIQSQMETNYPGITDYFIPYLWGTWGIMYSTLKEGLEEAVTSSSNEWSSMFDRSCLPAKTKCAMYDSHQHAYYAACQYLGLDYTVELTDNELNSIYNLIKQVKFDAWGTDNIKKDIVAKNIDLGFMWTGDFLYYYAEQAAARVLDAVLNNDIDIKDINTMIDELTYGSRVYTGKSGRKYQIGFDIFIPSNTVAFCDNLVISKDSSNKELAHKFIDFMCSYQETVFDEEVTPAYSNAYYVCYNTPFKTIYDNLVDLKSYSFTDTDMNLFNEETSSGTNEYDSTLYYTIYDSVIGIAFDKYYKKDDAKGNKLTNFNRKYINKINTTFNNARA